MIEHFRSDFKTYTKKTVSSTKSSIWQPQESYTDSSIVWIIVNLRRPREIGGTFAKQVSEYVLYSDTTQVSKRWDLIVDWDSTYSVITMRKIGDFDGLTPCHAHYLLLLE